MHYAELLPPPELESSVRCLWTLEGRAEDASVDPVFPDGSPELIINLADAFQAFDPAGMLVDQPRVMLVGQITRPFMVRPTGTVRLIAFRFHPFGAAALCDDMSAITEHWRDVFNTLPDISDIRRTRSDDDVQTVASEIALRLAPLLARNDKPHPDVRAACNAIRDSRGTVILDDLADTLGTSLRTLQRRFTTDVGIPPKLLARITRFQHVFAAWREDPRTLARVAADCGYYDQSHLIRDFRDFAGEAPATALASQPEFTSFFLP